MTISQNFKNSAAEVIVRMGSCTRFSLFQWNMKMTFEHFFLK